MAKKVNPKMLNEELKRFRMLSEYSFYTEEPKKRDDDDLILGSELEEADEDPSAAPDAGDDSKTAANDTGGDAGGDTGAAAAGDDDANNMFDTGDDAGGDAGTETGDETGVDTGAGAADDTGLDTGADQTGDDMGGDTGDIGGGEEEVDVDVTQLVKGSEEAKQSAQDASERTSELLAKFGELEQRVAAMDSLTTKIDTLEKEIVKRNPTPIEKLEMRSMDSFPYNIKLSDYWKDVDGYDATGKQEPTEYVLKKDDVEGAFDPSIKSTFNVPEDYEEEDITA